MYIFCEISRVNLNFITTTNCISICTDEIIVSNDSDIYHSEVDPIVVSSNDLINLGRIHDGFFHRNFIEDDDESNQILDDCNEAPFVWGTWWLW